MNRPAVELVTHRDGLGRRVAEHVEQIGEVQGLATAAAVDRVDRYAADQRNRTGEVECGGHQAQVPPGALGLGIVGGLCLNGHSLSSLLEVAAAPGDQTMVVGSTRVST